MKGKPDEEQKDEAPFVFADYLKLMMQDKQRAVKLIAYYFRTKRLKFSSKGEVQVAIRRHMRAAREVAEFEDQKIRAAFEEAKRMEQEEGIKFTMETIVKIMTK